MSLFKNRYRRRIEKKIVELTMKQVILKSEEDKISSLKPTDRVCYIIMRKECEKKIELLKSLL